MKNLPSIIDIMLELNLGVRTAKYIIEMLEKNNVIDYVITNETKQSIRCVTENKKSLIVSITKPNRHFRVLTYDIYNENKIIESRGEKYYSKVKEFKEICNEICISQ